MHKQCFVFLSFLFTICVFDQISNAQILCDHPQNIHCTAVGSNYARVVWKKTTGAAAYNIRGRITGSADWITMKVMGKDTVAKISNLKPNSEYELQMLAYCNSDLTDSSDWSEKIILNTDFPCQTPNKLFVDSISSVSAVLHWTGPLNSVKFTIRYKSKNQNSKWMAVSVKSGYVNSVRISDLTPGTEYLWTISCNCIGNVLNESLFAEPPVKFTTPIH